MEGSAIGAPVVGPFTFIGRAYERTALINKPQYIIVEVPTLMNEDDRDKLWTAILAVVHAIDEDLHVNSTDNERHNRIADRVTQPHVRLVPPPATSMAFATGGNSVDKGS